MSTREHDSASDAGRQRLERVIRALQEMGAQAAKSAKATENLCAIIADDKNGLIAAIDDLRADVREMTEVLHAIRDSGLLGKLFGS